MKLVIEPVADIKELMAIQEEWEALDSEVEPRTPFTSPLWIRLWWKYFRREQWWTIDHFFIHVVRDENRKLLAVAPLTLACRPAFGPIKLRALRFFGADTSLTEVRGVICRRKDETAVFRALRDFLYVRKPPWDLIEWKGILSGGDAKAILETAGPLALPVPTPMYFMQLPESWQDLMASVSSNMRKNVRKAYEAIQSTGHNFDFRVIEQVEDVGDALDHFFQLHSLRAHAPNMIVHPDKFTAPKNRAFITEYITEAAKRGSLRIFELTIEGEVVASRLSFYLNGTLYFYYAGYDPSWRDASVGTILIAEALKWAIGHGLKIVNLSAGKDLSKLRWKPTEIVFESYMQMAPSPRGRFLGGAYVSLYSSIRNLSAPRLRRPPQTGQGKLPSFTARPKITSWAQSIARWSRWPP